MDAPDGLPWPCPTATAISCSWWETTAMETQQSCAGSRTTMRPDWTAAIGVDWPTLLRSPRHLTATSGSIVRILEGSGSRSGCRYALVKGVKVTDPMAEIRIVLVDDHRIFRQ